MHWNQSIYGLEELTPHIIYSCTNRHMHLSWISSVGNRMSKQVLCGYLVGFYIQTVGHWTGVISLQYSHTYGSRKLGTSLVLFSHWMPKPRYNSADLSILLQKTGLKGRAVYSGVRVVRSNPFFEQSPFRKDERNLFLGLLINDDSRINRFNS